MRKLRRMVSVLLLAGMILSGISLFAVAESTNPEAKIEVQILVKGTPPLETDYFVLMTADDAAFPMPAGTAEGVYRQKTGEDGIALLNSIVYDKVGMYTYKIAQQVEGKTDQLVLDETIYDVTVTIIRDEETNALKLSMILHKEDAAEKSLAVVFINTRKTAPLSVTKFVWVPENVRIDSNKTFEYTLTLSEELSDEFVVPDGVTLKEDKKTLVFSLKSGETMVIPDLPVGVEYEIVERAENGYNYDAETKTYKSLYACGTIEETEENSETFINVYEKTGRLGNVYINVGDCFE